MQPLYLLMPPWTEPLACKRIALRRRSDPSHLGRSDHGIKQHSSSPSCTVRDLCVCVCSLCSLAVCVSFVCVRVCWPCWPEHWCNQLLSSLKSAAMKCQPAARACVCACVYSLFMHVRPTFCVCVYMSTSVFICEQDVLHVLCVCNNSTDSVGFGG